MNKVPIFQVRSRYSGPTHPLEPVSYAAPKTVSRFASFAEARKYIRDNDDPHHMTSLSIHVDPEEAAIVILGLETSG